MKNLYYLFILSFLLISCEEEVPPITYTLTTKVTPPGAGTVDPASGSYDEGSSVTISATPTENYSFKQWTGTGSGTANPLTFKIISNTIITAEFELIDADGDGVLKEDDCNDINPNSTTALEDLDCDGVLNTVDDDAGTVVGTSATVAGTAAATAADTEIEVDQQPARAFVFDPGIELQTLVDALNETGTTATDMVAILEALREAGALRAELIII